MNERIHDDEADTSEATVRMLLLGQRPEWADRSLRYLRTSGTDNAMWRVDAPGPDADQMVVRLPRTPGAAKGVAKELAVLPVLAQQRALGRFAIPTVLHAGEPEGDYPHVWAVLDWLDGADAWSQRAELEPSTDALALDLAEAVVAIAGVDGAPAPQRRAGARGGPMGALFTRLESWLTDPQWSANDLIDVDAVRAVAASAAAVGEHGGEPVFVHGDLIPGNLLVANSRLSAVIDWGGAGYGDPAQDIATAWSMLDSRGRRVFRDALDVDDATWLRATAIELEHAVGGVVYYLPKGHQLGDVMARTLGRILDEST